MPDMLAPRRLVQVHLAVTGRGTSESGIWEIKETVMFEHLTPKAKGAAEWLADYLEAAYLDGFTVDTLLEYIEPLLSALGETPWRPIDEAPKDKEDAPRV